MIEVMKWSQRSLIRDHRFQVSHAPIQHVLCSQSQPPRCLGVSPWLVRSCTGVISACCSFLALTQATQMTPAPSLGVAPIVSGGAAVSMDGPAPHERCCAAPFMRSRAVLARLPRPLPRRPPHEAPDIRDLCRRRQRDEGAGAGKSLMSGAAPNPPRPSYG